MAASNFQFGTYVNNNGKNTCPLGGSRPKYIRVCSGPQRGKYVHNLIAVAKLGRELHPWETVEHRDGDGQNNHPENIVVVTRPENTRLMHARRRGEEVPF